MGSLEHGVPLKRAPLLRSSSSTDGRPFFHRPRSRLARFLLFEKVDYLQWLCTVATFFFVVILFQAFLPASVVEKSGNVGGARRAPVVRRELGVLRGIGELDFGEGIRFVPSKLLKRFEKESGEANSSSVGRPRRRAGLLKPLLALVLPDMSVDSTQLHMVSIVVALKEIGYDIHVYALEDGPIGPIWSTIGLSISILSMKNKLETSIDWLSYNGILVAAFEAKIILSSLLQEPFKSVPVIWTLHEGSLALRLNKYIVNNQTQLINDWKQVFSRATVVVFPNYAMPIMYSLFDAGNFFVIPGSPTEAWRAENYLSLHNWHDPRIEMGYGSEDFLIAIVGSQFSYSGLWLEHALILQAIAPLRHGFSSASHLKVAVLSGNSTDSYKAALEALSLNFGYSSGSVAHIGTDGDVNSFLGIADIVIYGSFLEEQSFPAVLIQAMCLRKLIIAPDLAMIKKHIDDRVNGYLFSKKDIGMMTQILSHVISNGKLSPLAQNVGSLAGVHAKNFMVSETVEGYASLLEHVVNLPSEFASPKTVADIPMKLKEEWQWNLFENLTYTNDLNKDRRIYAILDKLEGQWNVTRIESSANTTRMIDEAFAPIDWGEEKLIEMVNARKRLEEEELKGRMDQPHGTWEDVYRNAKRADRARNELHERDDRELERTGQPLCIYEPYFGEGTWPFLHHKSLYRGIGLSSKGRRPGADDIDASSRLPILNNPYYRDVLGEYGAFFALANRIDRIHKNAWIGFQSWRAAARKASLSKRAESVLLESVQSRKLGDTLYFWVRMDKDPRNTPQQEFWSFCDAINAGNCRYAVSAAFRRMYGIVNDLDSLPPMPADGDTWSVMHCWALPTRSFLEFVMFARMFVDALDVQIYEEHHQTGLCYLSLSKV
uniref:D-inositol 3-phosphate glycosyltransferase n=1 Tax=Anthurium amnicola TaxID=1678845 RepID=A0A1D1Z063_9ARAE